MDNLRLLDIYVTHAHTYMYILKVKSQLTNEIIILLCSN